MDSKLNNNLSIVAKITSKNQITVPKEVRNKLNLKAQDSIKFTENKDGSFSMRKEKKKDLWTIVDEQEKNMEVFLLLKSIGEKILKWRILINEISSRRYLLF